MPNSENLTKITFKDIQIKLNVSERMAKTVLKDLKTEYSCPIVTMSHLLHYLKIPSAQNY